MPSHYSKSKFWKFVYCFWPPILRLAESLKFHNARQDYLLGRISPNVTIEAFTKLLADNGFESGILAWRDSGEIVGMRKLDKKTAQYHIRLFNDGEIRGHYEHAPEARPIAHVMGIAMEPGTDFFEPLLGGYLVKQGSGVVLEGAITSF